MWRLSEFGSHFVVSWNTVPYPIQTRYYCGTDRQCEYMAPVRAPANIIGLPSYHDRVTTAVELCNVPLNVSVFT